MKNILYFCPHQDDELLSMGIDICESVLQNNNVCVILCTDGSNSSVKNKLNNGQFCYIHKENHNYNLSEQEFIKARDLEFVSSCKALGVLPENICVLNNRCPDGNLSVTFAQETIKNFMARYGENVKVCTIAPYNKRIQHQDHYNLGQAAKDLFNNGYIKEIRFFIEPYCVPKWLKKLFLPFKFEKRKASSSMKNKMIKAFEQYSYWNPKENRYAIGYHSIKNSFDKYNKNNVIYYFDIKK